MKSFDPDNRSGKRERDSPALDEYLDTITPELQRQLALVGLYVFTAVIKCILTKENEP